MALVALPGLGVGEIGEFSGKVDTWWGGRLSTPPLQQEQSVANDR
jgi:hypothetical protein